MLNKLNPSHVEVDMWYNYAILKCQYTLKMILIVKFDIYSTINIMRMVIDSLVEDKMNKWTMRGGMLLGWDDLKQKGMVLESCPIW